MGNDRITITGTKPGYPILVRISYHPRWQALTGEKVWIAGPTFMLVFPKGDRVELVFGDSPVVSCRPSSARRSAGCSSSSPCCRRAAFLRRGGDALARIPPAAGVRGLDRVGGRRPGAAARSRRACSSPAVVFGTRRASPRAASTRTARTTPA